MSLFILLLFLAGNPDAEQLSSLFVQFVFSYIYIYDFYSRFLIHLEYQNGMISVLLYATCIFLFFLTVT